MREPDIYRIGSSPEELQSALISLRQDFDLHVHDGTNTRTFQTVVAETVSARAFIIKKTSFGSTTSGLWMGIDKNGTMKMNLGTASSNMQYDGSNFSITGGTITGGTVRTAASGQRVQLDSNYFRVFDASGNVITYIFGNALGSDVVFLVDIQMYAASNSTAGFVSHTKKGNAIVGLATGATDYSVSASAGGYSWSYTPDATDGFATAYFQAASAGSVALETFGGAYFGGDTVVNGELIAETDFATGGDGFFGGDVQVNGDFNVSGSKAAVIDTEEYGRLTYLATEAPTAYLTDAGEGETGKAVKLDQKLRASIEDNDAYLVFITPLSDIGSYHVSRETGQFTVSSERPGSFCWKVEAVRKGYQKFRFGPQDGFEQAYEIQDAQGNKQRVVRRTDVRNGQAVRYLVKDGKIFNRPKKPRISTRK